VNKMSTTKQCLANERIALRLKLLDAGVSALRFDVEGGNDGGHEACTTVLVARDGAFITDGALKEAVAGVLTSWVDAELPGWTEGDGGRSQIDWAVEVDAFQHQHFDNVKFERRRLLGAATDMSASSNILAQNARTALLLAMGDLAPADKSAQQYLVDGARVLIDYTRTDALRFLTEAQRELLISAIAGTRVKYGHSEEWIADVVSNGYVGYEHAPDTDLMQKLATESLDDLVEGICGPARITAGSDFEVTTRSALVEAFTLQQSLDALDAVADAWGDDLLESLRAMGAVEEEEADQPAAPSVP
jgi:hypothetical protein